MTYNMFMLELGLIEWKVWLLIHTEHFIFYDINDLRKAKGSHKYFPKFCKTFG